MTRKWLNWVKVHSPTTDFNTTLELCLKSDRKMTPNDLKMSQKWLENVSKITSNKTWKWHQNDTKMTNNKTRKWLETDLFFFLLLSGNAWQLFGLWRMRWKRKGAIQSELHWHGLVARSPVYCIFPFPPFPISNFQRSRREKRQEARDGIWPTLNWM